MYMMLYSIVMCGVRQGECACVYLDSCVLYMSSWIIFRKKESGSPLCVCAWLYVIIMSFKVTQSNAIASISYISLNS